MKSQPSRILTILNRKGGVGKTHTTWLMVGACLERKLKLCVIDLDEQRNITRSLLSEEGIGPGVDALLDPAAETDVTHLIRPTRFDGIDIIPSTPRLQTFDETSRFEWEREERQFAFVEPTRTLRDSYDWIVFDCPPNLSLVTFAALCASDYVVVPLEAADWGAQGIMDVSSAITFVHQRWNQRLRLLGYLVNQYKRARKYQQSYLAELRRAFGENAFQTVVPDMAMFEQSVVDKIPITRYAASSPAAGVCRAFFREVQSRAERIERVGVAGR